MSFIKFFLVYYVLPLALAGPLISRDTPCSPESMVDDQPVTTCPKKNTLDNSGNCQGIPGTPGSQGCTSYCELSLSKGYGQEIPFNQGYCSSGGSCGVANSVSISTTQTWGISGASDLGTGDEITKLLTSSFNLGASWSESQTLTYTTTIQHTKTTGANQCGYWTFIPYVMTSCGTVTSVPTGSLAGQHGSSIPYCMVKGTKTNQQNWCNKSMYSPSKGTTDGEVVFVYLDCAKGGLLQDKDIPQDSSIPGGPAAQPPAIFYPGVFTGSNAGH